MVVAYGDEPLLVPGVRALAASEGVDVEVVLVDNGCTDGAVDTLRGEMGVTVIDSGRNLGFAEGCDVGIAAGTGEFVTLVNPDAIAAPAALARLVAALADPSVGIATASVRLASDPDRMNSAGNVVHFLGFSRCGGLNAPAVEFTQPRDVACASGAAMALRRSTWTRLGGFAPEYFAYYEDSELSLRSWQQGRRVVFVPDAVVTHRYEFNRNPDKMYLVERNRAIAVLTLFEGRTLALLAPVLLAAEVAILARASSEGWARAKVSGWRWLWRHRRWIRERRGQLQRRRTVGDRAIAGLYDTHLDGPNEPLSPTQRQLDRLLAAYWSGVRTLLRA